QRHRFRAAGGAPAGDGVRPPGGRQAARATGRRLPPHVRRGVRGLPGRRTHRRVARPCGARRRRLMAAVILPLLLAVADLDASLRFYCDVLGFAAEGEDGPFTVVRVGDDFVLLLSPFGSDGGEHLAFAMEPAEFDAAFARIRAAGVAFGDRYDA